MIEIKNITVQFGGVKPLDNLTVTLDQPIVGLIGPNGAGKTTLLNVFSGFVTPTSGEVAINGKSITQRERRFDLNLTPMTQFRASLFTRMKPHKRVSLGLRRTFQTDQIADDLTLLENVQAVADHGFAKKSPAMQEDVKRAIDYVGLTRRLHRKGSDLSTEERHLAEIAKALIGKPSLVMLDEPGAGMSEAESEHLAQVIRGIPDYCGAQVFLIDHDVDLIVACCSQTMVLDFGKLLAVGPTRKVLELPEVRKAYLGDFGELERAA
ncbi:MAG: ATP-binding cassette domain-containing protein [Candidatus Symbiobacter sp.]|nr:ATP-binding cassette domain-containing protein [Candidatus Symbiobacter sp.]